MQNNKIYTTLANLYNQVKGVLGDTGRDLSEEIDYRVENHSEVLTARKGHNTLIDKVNAIDNSIDGTNAIIMGIGNRVNKTETDITDINSEINVIKTTNPTVALENGNHLLVNMSSRPSHKSDMFSLNANEQYRANANSEHYVNQLYVRDNIHNKEIDMAFTTENSSFDNITNELRGGSLYSIFTGEMELPLSTMVMANQLYDNIAAVPGLCDVQAVVTSAYINESNHVVSSFRRGYEWTVKSKMAEIILNFIHPIEITKVLFDFKANTTQQSVVLYKSVNSKWVEVSRVPSTDGHIDVNEKLQSIKIGFHSLSEQSSTILTIKDIKVFSKEYGKNSATTSVTELVDLYDLSGYASIAPIIDIPDHTICKFGVNTQSKTNECYVYYPSRRYLDAGLFSNNYHMPVIGKIRSITKDSHVLESRYAHKSPTGSEGSLTIGSTSWSEDSTVSFSDGYKLDDLTYIKLYINVGSSEKVFALSQSALNRITNIVMDGVDIAVEVKRVGSSIKLAVKSSHTLASVRCEMNILQNVYDGGTSDAVRSYSGSSVSTSYDSVTMKYSLASKYYCYKNYYTWTWYSWNSWWWAYDYTRYSGLNKDRSESIVFVDCDNLSSNRCTTRRSTYSRYISESFVLSNVRSAVAYIGTDSNALNSFNTDGEIIPSYNSSRVSMANEFIGHLKVDRTQNVVKVEPDQYANSISDVEYFLSFNNYNFYTYTHETNAWVQTKTGMSAEDITRIPSYAFEKLFSSDDIYVKIKINNKDAYVNGLEIEFDKDKFNTIDSSALMEYGMNLSDIKDISPTFIMKLINEFSTLSVTMQSESKLRCWQYIVPGIQLIEYGGISWNLAGSDVATQHISGNMLIIKNVSKEVKHFKLEQKFFEDSVVVVGDKLQNDAFDKMAEEVQVLIDDTNTTQAKIDTLDQNVQLLHRAMSEGLSAPLELPTYIIPAQAEIDLEPLSPGNSAEIKDIKNLRYVQFWDTQKHPVPEFVEHKAVKDLQHQFIYENGAFTSNYFEMGKYYDTDNSYLMSRGITSDSYYRYETSQYVCTAKRSDNASQAPVNNKNLSLLLSYPNDSDTWSTGWANDWSTSNGNVAWILPGENARWIDIDFEFKEETYIYGLLNCDFAGYVTQYPDGHHYDNDTLGNYTYQITTIFLDYDASGNWVSHSSYAGLYKDKNIYIQKPVRKLRIRCEVPYSHNRGAARVSFKYLDLYYCPVRYLHDVDAKIMPILYYNTETWQRLMSVSSDATISGTATDIHYLFETNNELQNEKKYWGFNGSSLIQKASATYSNGMTLQQFNNLTESQLTPLLNYQYVRPIAILDSVDGHHTPYLRNFKMNYAEKEYSTTSLVNPQDINTRYDKESQKLIVTNATNSIKTLKAIIS